MSYEMKMSPNASSRNGQEIEGIVLHYTAGGDIEGTLRWFQNPAARSSAHYVVSRSGRIVNVVAENMKAWHAGSATTIPKLNGKKNVNSRTIGIEICNWGFLYEAPFNDTPRIAGDIYTRYKNWSYPYKGLAPKRNIVDFTNILDNAPCKKNWPGGKSTIYLWEPYPFSQITAVKNLILDILSRYPHISKDCVVGHSEVDPKRKIDPGPLFPLTEMLDEIFETEDDSDFRYKISKLKGNEATEDEMLEMHEPRDTTNKPWFCR